MVYSDISDLDHRADFYPGEKKWAMEATVFQRLLSVVLDYFILAPILSFICVLIFSEGLSLYRNFPESAESKIILIQIAVGYVFLLTLFQTASICFFRATPGQIFTKIYIQFDSEETPEKNGVFFQAWLRQLGFVFSVAFLGLPFIAILYHPKRRAFYERMTESSVVTHVQNQFRIFNWGSAERRYISVFVATFLFFVMALGVAGFKNLYQKNLISNLTFKKMKKNKHFCQEIESVKQENRLIVATALNMVGVLSDRCLDLEADFVLWRNFSTEVGIEQKAMAYFSKYMAAKSTSDEDQYLAQVCAEGPDSQACQLAQIFLTGQIDQLNKLEENLLTTVLEHEFATDLNFNTDQSLKKIEKYSTHKLVRKFIITESLENLKSISSRSPASENEVDSKIKKLQQQIDKL